ncbi:MAG TPA: glycosyltransferase [Steroidobacteraceae bacterium]|jgi:hypothetical protein|nr:glycosyltransferase [Steroidobacteraceae bacterium]
MGRRSLYVYGFPALYGGANTELQHQIHLWLRMGVQVHVIPTDPGYLTEPLYDELRGTRAIIHAPNNFRVIERDAPVIGFCCDAFLSNIDLIREHSANTVWVNCMSHLWSLEKRRAAEGKIGTFLYQNPDVRDAHAAVLRDLNRTSTPRFLVFTSYLDAERFPLMEDHSTEHFGCGRISRAVPEKYARHILHIYEYFVAPKPKQGLFLGFDDQCAAKIGKPPSWIRTARNHLSCSQRALYEHCEIILQPTDTIENWPRVGLEAMSSGSVLIVDNRGGWRRQVRHGVTGWLCGTPQDFIYYASKMAYEPQLRLDMARQARQHLEALAGEDLARESWDQVFREIM